MDISKLPRLSQTQQESAPAEAVGPAAPAQDTDWCPNCHAPNAAGATFCNNCGRQLRAGRTASTRTAAEVGTGADAWVSIAVGVILLLMSPRLIQYLVSPGTFTWTFSDEQGHPLSYTRSVFFWGDLSITLFAAVLIVEGLVIAFAPRAALVLAALVLTVLTTAMNVIFLGMMVAKGYGVQILSALAVAFGVYIALFQWRMWNAVRPRAV